MKGLTKTRSFALMTPRFAHPMAWQQAELLMQPTFIRIIDNIRKQLETSSWRGTYHDVQRWPQGTTDEQKAKVSQYQRALKTAPPEQIEILHRALDQLPRPYPGYELHLTHNDHAIEVDLWQLCYQVCFCEFSSANADGSKPVEVDTHLIDETGDVDWHHLDEKAKHTVGQVFENLPN